MSGGQAFLWKPWIYHGTDSISGLLVTVPATSGALILTAITVLVGLAGDAAWTITAQALHQFRSTNEPQTGLFRTSQVFLRNAGGAVGSAIDLASLGHAWSGKISHAKRKLYGLAAWPLLIKAGFVVAAVLVGRITTAAYEANVILLEDPDCGLVAEPFSNNSSVTFDVTSKYTNDIRQSRAYAYDCYDSTNQTFGCTSLKTQTLLFESNPNASCPFGDLCLLGPQTALQLFTPKLNSLTHLGINSAPEDQVEFQIATTCSVISAKDYTQQIPDPHSNGKYDLAVVYLGGIQGTSINYTYMYAELQSKQSVQYTTFAAQHYAATSSLGAWEPIEQLSLSNADTSVLFTAANGLLYQQPTNDPMYFANGKYKVTEDDGVTWYEPNYYFTTMACADQVNICNPVTGDCSDFQGTFTSIPFLNSTLHMNEIQQATAQRIIISHQSSHVYDIVSGQGGTALYANNFVYDIFSAGLPDNQWQIEVTKWFQTTLSNVQHRIADFPTNAWTANGLSAAIVLPARDYQMNGQPTTAMETLCTRQLVRSTDEYQSFHLWGIIIVVLISVALLITSWTLTCCIRGRSDRRTPGAKKYHKRLAWTADGKAQLLRMALIPAGYRDGWENEMDALPSRHPTDEEVESDIHPPGVHDRGVTVSQKQEQEWV